MRQALSLGTSAGDFGVALGGNKQLSQGEVRTVDIDISTPEGFAAYQKFVADGQMPQSGRTGHQQPAQHQRARLLRLHRRPRSRRADFKLGGVLADSEGDR